MPLPMPVLTGRLSRLSALTPLALAIVVSTMSAMALPVAAQAPAAAAHDRDVPLQFDAGQMKIDAKRRVRMLTGGVQLTRGTFWLSSQQVELRETAQGGDLAIATSGAGQQARFKQRREGLDEIIDGQADRIEYDSKTETVRLIGNALLKRLRGTEVTEEVSGQIIVYEHGRETFEVQGGSSGSRVKGVVTPQPKPEAGR